MPPEGDRVTPGRRMHWVPTHVYETKQSFSLVLYMGTVRMPSMKEYWSQEEMYKNTFVTNCMSRNRFQLLLRTMTADNEVNFSNSRLKT